VGIFKKKKCIEEIIVEGIKDNLKIEKEWLSKDPENRHIDKFGRPWIKKDGKWIEG